MTYEEFKRKIESDSNYYVDKEHGGIAISNADYTIVWINNAKSCSISTMHYTTYDDECFMAEYWDVISDFVATPIEDRIQEQKFYLKHRYLYMNEGYLHVLKPYNTLGLGLKSSGKNHENIFKNTFTTEEIERLKFKHCTDLHDFKFIPVEEEK